LPKTWAAGMQQPLLLLQSLWCKIQPTGYFAACFLPTWHAKQLHSTCMLSVCGMQASTFWFHLSHLY
jgi:hypothetical protein